MSRLPVWLRAPAMSAVSPTTGARLSTCSRWCTEIRANRCVPGGLSRDELTGGPESSGDFLPTAQGDDVVSGVRSRSMSPSCACGCIRSPISSWIVPKLAGHYNDMHDTEFTVEEAVEQAADGSRCDSPTVVHQGRRRRGLFAAAGIPQPDSLISLAVAVAGGGDRRGMPFRQALGARAEGPAFGFLSIMWKVINARTPALLVRIARPTARKVRGHPPVEGIPFGGDERAWGAEYLAVSNTQILYPRLRQLLDDGAQLIEVLPAENYVAVHLPGAINIPLKSLDARSSAALDRSKPVVVYCWDGL
jgi:Rhodanese-like domain